MNVLLLGVGMQGKAALHDLASSEAVAAITAADLDLDRLESHVAEMRYAKPIDCRHVDAAKPESLDRLMELRPDVVIDLLPVSCIEPVTRAAVRHEIHLVNTFYTAPIERELADLARERGVTILPEFGLDPGIDLVLLGQAARSLDRIEELVTYGGGIPEPAAADNSLKYKVSWTFAGVLRAYRRAGRVIREQKVIDIPDDEIFSPTQIHEIEIGGLGTLEAYPNGDVTDYLRLLGLESSQLRHAGRYALRWPGHSAFWKVMVDLRLLDDAPVVVDGVEVNRRRFLTAAVEPEIRYRAEERDMIVIRVELRGWKGGRRAGVAYQVIDRRDLATGHLAMARSVGYTASIGAQMIGTGGITKRGLLNPVNDVPYAPFARELRRRGIRISAEEVEIGPDPGP